MEYTTATTNMVLIAITILTGLYIMYKSRNIESNPMKEHRNMVKAMNEVVYKEDPDLMFQLWEEPMYEDGTFTLDDEDIPDPALNYEDNYCGESCPKTHTGHECDTNPGRGYSFCVFGFNHLVCPDCMTKNHEGE